MQKKYEAGEIDKKQLADLGFTPEELKSFGEKLEQKKRQRRIHEEEPLEPFDWGDDPNDRKAAAHGDGATAHPGAAPEDRAKLDTFRQSLEQVRSEVSPEYREILEEYYRALTGH